MKNKKIWMGVLVAAIVVVLAVFVYIYIIPHASQQDLTPTVNQSWCERGQAVQYERGQAVQYKGLVKRSELADFTVVMKVSYRGENFCWIKGAGANGEYYVNQNSTKALRLERNETAKSFKLAPLR